MKEEFNEFTIHEVKVKKGQSWFDALWASGLFKSKSFLRNLFKQGGIKIQQ